MAAAPQAAVLLGDELDHVGDEFGGWTPVGPEAPCLQAQATSVDRDRIHGGPPGAAVEWLASEGEPPGGEWLNDREATSDLAAPQVQPIAPVDDTEARKTPVVIAGE